MWFLFVGSINNNCGLSHSYPAGIFYTMKSLSSGVVPRAGAEETTDPGYSLFKNSSITDNVNSVVLLP